MSTKQRTHAIVARDLRAGQPVPEHLLPILRETAAREVEHYQDEFAIVAPNVRRRRLASAQAALAAVSDDAPVIDDTLIPYLAAEAVVWEAGDDSGRWPANRRALDAMRKRLDMLESLMLISRRAR
jgi:hypothetical protein